MIESAAGEFQARRNIFCFEVRQFFKDLLLRETGGQQVQHVDDANAHPTDTGPSTTLLGVDRDSLDEFGHGKASWMGKALEPRDLLEGVY